MNNIKKILIIIILFLSSIPIPLVGSDEPPRSMELIEQNQYWNKYQLEDGTYQLEIGSSSLNYYDESWQPINPNFYLLPSEHLAYTYGYRVGNEHGLFNAYFKPNMQEDYPVAFAYNKSEELTHVLRSKLLAVGYVESDYEYVTLQNVQDSQGDYTANKVFYEDAFTGTWVNWTYKSEKLKEEIVLSNTTKTFLQNNPPSSFGLSNQDSYLVFITKLDYQGLHIDGHSGNFTATGTINFCNVTDDVKFAMPIGTCYEQHNEFNTTKLIYKIIQYQGNNYLLSGLKVTELNMMTFPVVIDPTLSQTGTIDDGHLIASDTKDFTRCWEQTNANSTNIESDYLYIGTEGTYNIYRSVVYFDTSALNSSMSIPSGTLSLNFNEDHLIHDTSIIVQNNNPYPTYPLGVDDYDRTHYSDQGGSFNSTNVNEGQRFNITLNATGLGYLNLSHQTSFMLRTDTEEKEQSGGGYWRLNSGTSPKLYINYSYVDVATNVATNILEQRATLSGTVNHTSGTDATTRFEYGTTAAYGTNTSNVGSQAAGTTRKETIAGLTVGTFYHFRYYGTDGTDDDHGEDRTFITKPNNATGLTIVKITGGHNLSWTHGDGYNKTRVVYATEDTLSSPSDGTLLCNLTNASASWNHMGLTDGTTYYYAAWEYAENNASDKNYFQWSNQSSSANALYVVELECSVNDTTSIEENTATLNGHINYKEGEETITAGFWVGTTTPVTDANDLWNITAGSEYAYGDEFDVASSDEGWQNPGTQYYVRSWVDNGSTFNYSTNTLPFCTKPNGTTGLTATTIDYDTIDLAWTKGTGAEKTLIIAQKDAYPTDRTDGTSIYNDTGSSYSFSADAGTDYYFKVWAIDTTGTLNNVSDTYTQSNAQTPPGTPTVTVSLVAGTTTVNCSWTNGTNATGTIVRRKSTAYPTSITDGSAIANTTGKPWVTNTTTTTQYYSVWHYETIDSNFTLSAVAHGDIGGLNINCFHVDNSSNKTVMPVWGLVIRNATGTQVYEDPICSNTKSVTVDDIPKGEKVRVIINATKNRTRYYYMDITSSTWVTLNTYLPRNDSTELYYAQVTDDYGLPVEDVYVSIRRKINTTYENVSYLYTDTNGYFNIYLQPEIDYIIVLNKTGYDEKISEWTPDPDYFGIYYPKTFRISKEQDDYQTYVFNDTITFEGWRSGTNIRVNYTDALGKTTSLKFLLYEINTTTSAESLNSTFENTSNCSTNFTINASNSYVVWLDLDHAVLGKENDSYTHNLSMPLYFYVTPTAIGSDTWIDNMFTVLLGENPLGWINLISYILAIVILMTFSVFNAPLGLIGSGFALGFLNIYLSFSIITIGLCTFLIVLGILGLAKQYTSGVRR
jgi:hypothetical protein